MKQNAAWELVTLEVPIGDQETASVLLFEMGSAGIVTVEERADYVTLGAYFDSSSNTRELQPALQAELAKTGLADRVRCLSVEPVQEQDWSQKWREGLTPVEVGRLLLIAPSWSVPDKSEGRAVIQIDPGMAFGTGTHETTRMCLEAIERYWKGGRLLDVGTGTGILAIAAALLAPRSHVVAIDVDPQAVEVARENLQINEASVELSVAQPRDLKGGVFDIVVANLTAEAIVDLISDLLNLLAAEGVMLLSGILTELADDVERALNAAGLVVIERMAAGEWSALVVKRAHLE